MIDLHKIYFVLDEWKPIYVSLDKSDAHKWAEDRYGSRSDGICCDNIHVNAANYELI